MMFSWFARQSFRLDLFHPHQNKQGAAQMERLERRRLAGIKVCAMLAGFKVPLKKKKARTQRIIHSESDLGSS